MKVLLLVHGLPVGGTEMMVCHLARWLRGECVEVAIGCLDQIGELGATLADEGFEVELYRRKAGFDPGLPQRIAAHVRGGGFDLVHAHQYTCFFYGVLGKIRFRRPLIFTEHGRFHPDLPSPLRRLFNRVFRRLADCVTAVSEGVKQSLYRVEGFPPDSVEVLYNGIDIDRLASGNSPRKARELLGLPAGALVVGTVGRLGPIKNQGLLIRSLARLRNDLPEARLVIVGDGPARSGLERTANEIGVDSFVHFLGERNDVDRLLPAFDVFALSSLSEGTPMTLLEAMAATIPIVSTAVGGVPEILADGREALLVAPPSAGDDGAAALSAALYRILADDTLAGDLSRAAAAAVRARFSLDAVCGRYYELYGALLRRGAPVRQTS